jgi:hypothetical protein
LNAFRTALAGIHLPGAEKESSPFARALEYHMGRNVKFAENQRAMVALMRAMLDFVDARKKSVRVNKGVFVFDSNADVAAFNALVASLQREVARGETIWNETRSTIDQAAAAPL